MTDPIPLTSFHMYDQLPYHAGQRSTAVSFVAGGPLEAPLSFFIVLLPVPPITAHPLGEVPIIVLIIVHKNGWKQSKRQRESWCVELSVRLLSPGKKKIRAGCSRRDKMVQLGQTWLLFLLLLMLSWSFSGTLSLKAMCGPDSRL